MKLSQIGRSKARILQPGECLADSYTVKEQILGGGFADIYIVLEKGRKEPLILKVPQAKFQTNEKWTQLFVYEAELWINLGISQNIVTAHNVLVIDGNIHLFVEYIDGCTLGDRITSKGMDLRELVRIAMDVANGLSYAWRHNGIVHGDVRPENVLISKGGDVKITDFGLAYSYRNLIDAFSKIKGKTDAAFPFPSKIRNPHFMSPEQLLDFMLVDTRSDVYSFGVLLYKMATGSFPFFDLSLNDLEGIRTWHQHGTVIPPTELREDLLQELSELIIKCLNKDPRKRFQDFEEVWAGLKQVSDTYGFTSIYDKYGDEDRQLTDEMTEVFSTLLTTRLEEEGLALQELGMHAEAIEKFDKAIENNPHEFSTWWNKGNSHFLLGEASKALDSFMQAKKLNPENIAVSLRIGRCLQVLHRYNEALDELNYFVERASKEEDGIVEAHMWRGQIYLIQNHYEEADMDFRKAVELLDLEDQIDLAEQVKTLEDLEKLLEQFVIDLQKERIPEALAWFFWNRGLLSFFQYIDVQLSKKPKDSKLLLMKGIAYGKLGKSNKAEKCFRDALELSPQNPEIAVYLVELLIDSERDAEAEKLLDNVLSLYPKYVPALVDKSHLLAKIGDNVAARKCLEMALEVESENISVLNGLGILFMDEDPELAANYFKRVAKLDSDSTAAIHNLIILAKRKEDLEEVLNLCDSCLERDPFNVQALLDKALIHGMRGEIELAIKFAAQAYRLDPKNENVAEAYKVLREFPSRVRETYERMTCGDKVRFK
ncbi:MAG: hypothetical protein AYK18_07855 [Theionarchaea archaeon DG-70]|nr:MAG: hypothetical protein AYK18_07855 [Theionarchaea archaeon DG-70]MBU7026936.1 protein kinase [Theionarchaea archaeon]